ncbi:MAG: DUF2156 domain-containing protein [Burkholderiaceae bacterium]|nr:DUF2156 domain-containing protein [Burkholderiaceae bacterium]
MKKKMQSIAQSAGAGAVRSFPSRLGSLIEESRPLHLFVEAIPAMRRAMDHCGVPAFAFSPMNALPKIGLGKLTVEAAAGAVILSDDNTDRVVPTGSQNEYYREILTRLDAGRELALVPEHIAKHLKAGGVKVAKQHEEYIIRTNDVQTFPGGRNRQMRGDINRARRLCTVESYDPANLDEYKNVVRTWYRQNAELKFRTYDKTSIDWLLHHWPELVDAVPSMTCLGVRHEGKLVSVNMGCQLTATHWTAYTQRFDRDCPVKHVSMFGFNQLAFAFAHLEVENDGTADTKSIRAWKERVVDKKIDFYTVKR